MHNVHPTINECFRLLYFYNVMINLNIDFDLIKYHSHVYDLLDHQSLEFYPPKASKFFPTDDQSHNDQQSTNPLAFLNAVIPYRLLVHHLFEIHLTIHYEINHLFVNFDQATELLEIPYHVKSVLDNLLYVVR